VLNFLITKKVHTIVPKTNGAGIINTQNIRPPKDAKNAVYKLIRTQTLEKPSKGEMSLRNKKYIYPGPEKTPTQYEAPM
jgi:hypothetical protein